MASGFPGSIDSFTNPLSNSALNSPSHAGQHQDLNDAVNKIETYMGLVKVIPTSATNGTVAANGTVTVGNAVTSVTISGCFSALYDNYRIIYKGGSSTASNDLAIQLGSTTTGYYYGSIYKDYGGGAVASIGVANGANWTYAGCQDTPNSLDVDIFLPFATAITNISANYVGSTTGRVVARGGGMLNNTTSYTDLKILVGAGNITGGSIRIYGYRN